MDELKEVMGGCLNEEKDWEEMMESADLNGDHQISFEEFRQMMMSYVSTNILLPGSSNNITN